jgi:hypothetical protein
VAWFFAGEAGPTKRQIVDFVGWAGMWLVFSQLKQLLQKKRQIVNFVGWAGEWLGFRS